MNKIITLEEHLRNLIAAGEVVDRPSAIVKELIENAIDAAGKQITVHIKNGGLDEITVADDGEGMSKTDLELAFLPHTTSKIRQAGDLNRVTSLGFRGEALAAIGAVSRAECLTNDGNNGHRLVNNFGSITPAQPQSRDRGTTITVTQLFYQTPARLKFLKTVDYETALISDILQKFALSYLDISFRYLNNGKEVFYSPGNNKLEELLFNIYGPAIYKHFKLLEVADYDFKVFGYITDAHYSRSNRFGISLFINNRLINANNLTKAISKAYGDYLPKGRYPLVVLKISTDPQLTDVNVSPTKWQIRISKESGLIALLDRGIKEVLRQESSAQIAALFKEKEEDPQTTTEQRPSEYAKVSPEEKVVYQQLQLDESPVLLQEDPVIAHLPTVIGQAFGKYIIASFSDELWLIDQHAAMERCNYEKFRAALLISNAPSQLLNLPPIEVTMGHIQRLAAINEQLKPLGLKFEEYGVNKLLIRSIPLWISQVDIEAVLAEVLDFCLANEQVDITELRKAALYSLSCHSSIKFNEYLNAEQQNQLVKDLLSCENPYNCPHGRPTIVKLTDKQLAKEFARG